MITTLVITYTCVFGGQQRVLTGYRIEGDPARICEVHMNEKVIGKAVHNKEFCAGLLDRVKIDLQKKGYTCTQG